MAERDENGRLKKGHGGLKPKGAKSEKTKQWEAMAELFGNELSEGFIEIMKADLDDSTNHPDEEMAAMARSRYAGNVLKMAEYFKPKLSRTVLVGDNEAAPVQIIVKSNL